MHVCVNFSLKVIIFKMKNLKKMFFFFFCGGGRIFLRLLECWFCFGGVMVVVNYFNWGFGFVMWGVFFFGG